MDTALKVAVIGASGIGKHHAKWYAMTGCRVAAFVGTSLESCARTRESLKKLFGFEGNTYQDVDVMLGAERPDIVDVCTPHRFHYEHGMRALRSGAHVMCEKPLVWEAGKPTAQLLAQGREMIEEAKARGLTLGVSTQYVAALGRYREVYESARGPLAKADTFFMDMESKGGVKEFEVIWLDLASHPLSMLMELVPHGDMEPDSLRLGIGRKRNTARFRFGSPGSGSTAVELVLGDVAEGTPRRRFGVNGYVVDVGGKADEQGVYRSVLRSPDGETVFEDTMHTTIAAFVEAVRGNRAGPLVSGETGLRNLELQLGMLDRAQRV